LLLLLSESIGLPIWIVGRTDSAALPVALLAVAAGLTSLPPRRALLTGILLASICVMPLAEHYMVDHRSQERLMAESLLRMTDAGDTVVVTGRWVPALRYYFSRAAEPPELRTFPAEFEERTVLPGWEASYHGEAPRDAAREVVAGLRREGRDRVWLVLDDQPAYQIIGEEMAVAYRPVSFFRAPEPLPITVIRFEARAGSDPPLPPSPGDA
jgi:hypothetical protein